MSKTRIEGSCLCEKIHFHAQSPTLGSAHCHCFYCRRAHGAAFVTWVLVSEGGFGFDRGAEYINWFQSSPQSQRGFCSCCGSTLFFKSSLCPGEVHIVRANLGESGIEKPEAHCFVDQKVEWVSIDDGLPKIGSDSETLARYQAVENKG